MLYKSILSKKTKELKRVSPRTKLCTCNAFNKSDPGYLMGKGLVRNHIQAQKNPKKTLTFFQNRKTEIKVSCVLQEHLSTAKFFAYK